MNQRAKNYKVKISFDITEKINQNLEKMAVKENRTKAELLREYIERGMSVDGLLGQEQLLRKIIRQEIDNKLDGFLNRIVSICVKGAITSAAAFFLCANALSGFVRPELQTDFDRAVTEAKKLGVSYVGLNDDTVEEFLAKGLQQMRKKLKPD